jgi:hypothetical protein
LQQCLFPSHFGELVSQFLKIELTQIDHQPFGVILTRLLRADGLVDDLMEFFEQLGNVRSVTSFL